MFSTNLYFIFILNKKTSKIPWTSYEEERLGRLNLHRAYGVKDEQGKKNSYLPDGFVWMDGGTGAWDLVKGKIC